MSVTLTSISPLSGPPGTVVTCLGAGFDAGSQVACPTAQQTMFVSAAQITASIPLDLSGPAGGTMQVGIYVMGSDGSTSSIQFFTVNFPAAAQQSWTTVEAVAGDVPGFQRGGQIDDSQITRWMVSIAQSIASVMLRRGLSLSPSDWSQPASNAEPSPAGVLEMINRLGAAARLAYASGALFGNTEWALAKTLQSEYMREKNALDSGDYDKLFNPAAVSAETGQQFGGFTPMHSDAAFRKDQKF